MYRFNSTSQSFQQVDDPAWDESTEPVVFCDVQDRRDVAFGVGPGYLTFEGREIPIAGRTIIDVWGALNSPVVAVLSTDGSYVNVPAFTALTVSGQYYHQLFSEVDGSPIGEPVRIGVGGRSPDLSVCWSAEETQVIYSEFSSQLPGGYLSICVVDVGDEMAAFRGE